MNSRYIVIAFLLITAIFVAPLVAAFAPQVGDQFSYHEVANLGNGTGDYAGYTEQTVTTGTESVTNIDADGNVSTHFGYSWTFDNGSGTTQTGSSSGDFTFSPVSFLYVNGTDDQTGYENPSVWFCMDNSLPVGGTFYMLDTQMAIVSKNYTYYLPSQDRNVIVIFAQGISSYERNDVYGQFSADYTWNAYFDPVTGYIVGYNYEETDKSASASFTYTENLYITSASYPLSTAPATPFSTVSPAPSSTSIPVNQVDYTPAIALIIGIALLVAIIVYALSRRSRLPKHSSYQQPYQPPPPGPPPEKVDLTPKQPPVQQVVIKEVVKVKCRYCGALIDSTAETCPFCGAPRT